MRRTSLSALIALALAACGDDPILPPSDLTPAEVQALSQALLERSLSLEIPETGGADAGAVAREVVEFSTTVSGTVPCESGGSIAASAAVTGTIDTEAQTANISYETSQNWQSCVVNGEEVGAITVGGTVGSAYEFTVNPNESVQFSGGVDGSITWSTTGDRSGTCQIQLAFSGSANADETGTASLSGTVCGTAVSQSVSVS